MIRIFTVWHVYSCCKDVFTNLLQFLLKLRMRLTKGVVKGTAAVVGAVIPDGDDEDEKKKDKDD